MKSDNAIIIALIAAIVIVALGYFFIVGNGITFNNENQMEQPSSNIVLNNTTNPTVTTATQSSGHSSSDSSNSEPATSTASSDSSSSDSQSQDTQSQDTQTQDSQSQVENIAPASSTPQAGQAEGTYNPSDFD